MFDKYVIDKDKVACRFIDSKAVILNLDTGSYYNINEAGTQIWEALANDMGTSEIITLLTKEYALSSNQAKRDLSPFLKALENAFLIKGI